MENLKNKMEEWLQKIAATKTLSNDVIAVNVGLFETDGGYAAYLYASDEYDDEDEDWACGEPMEDSYLMLTGEPYESVDWETFLSKEVEAMKEILASGNEAIDNFFGARIITTGFDDGNLVRLR